MLKAEINQLSELNHDLAIRLRKLNLERGYSEELFRILQPAMAGEALDPTKSNQIAALGGLATVVVACLGLLLIVGFIK